MNMNMYVYRMTETPDSESAGEPGEPLRAHQRRSTIRRFHGALLQWTGGRR